MLVAPEIVVAHIATCATEIRAVRVTDFKQASRAILEGSEGAARTFATIQADIAACTASLDPKMKDERMLQVSFMVRVGQSASCSFPENDGLGYFQRQAVATLKAMFAECIQR